MSASRPRSVANCGVAAIAAAVVRNWAVVRSADRADRNTFSGTGSPPNTCSVSLPCRISLMRTGCCPVTPSARNCSKRLTTSAAS